jgi:hypothetical protein
MTAAEFDRLWALAHERLRRGDVEGAIVSLCRAIVARRDEVNAQRLLCRLLQDHPAAFASPAPPQPPGRPLGLVSVVTCSIDSRKFDRVRASYARAFGDTPWELIGIHDARSLAEGYARGLAGARGETIVFSHDDIDVLSGDLGGALGRAFASADVVGVVGTTKLLGPAHAWGGTEHARGRIVQPSRSGAGLDLVLCNLATGTTTSLEAVDGVFIAATRGTVEAIGFDARTFDGFHLYDLDFTYRAHLAGMRVGVSSEIVLRHDSEGRFDARWEACARRFLAKFPQVNGTRAPNAVAVASFADAASLIMFCARLDEAGRRAAAPDSTN